MVVGKNLLQKFHNLVDGKDKMDSSLTQRLVTEEGFWSINLKVNSPPGLSWKKNKSKHPDTIRLNVLILCSSSLNYFLKYILYNQTYIFYRNVFCFNWIIKGECCVSFITYKIKQIENLLITVWPSVCLQFYFAAHQETF